MKHLALLWGVSMPLIVVMLVGHLWRGAPMRREFWILLAIAVVGILAFLLSGCMATDPAAWASAPDAQTTIKAAILECKTFANQERLYAASYGGAVLPIVSLFAAPGTFRECMEAKGFRAQ